MAAECTVCHLILPGNMIHQCDHCQKHYCFPHLMEHDKSLEGERAILRTARKP